MKLYDEVIQSWYDLMEGHTAEKLVISQDEDRWEDVGKNNVILRGDMAYELGGGTLPAIEEGFSVQRLNGAGAYCHTDNGYGGSYI